MKVVLQYVSRINPQWEEKEVRGGLMWYTQQFSTSTFAYN